MIEENNLLDTVYCSGGFKENIFLVFPESSDNNSLHKNYQILKR